MILKTKEFFTNILEDKIIYYCLLLFILYNLSSYIFDRIDTEYFNKSSFTNLCSNKTLLRLIILSCSILSYYYFIKN